MPRMHKSTWKRRESKAAGLFGSKRQRLSGGSGRDDCSRSDSTHPDLFIECKTRSACAVRSLFDATRKLAKAEAKVPILMLALKGRPGFLVVAHSDDMARVAEAYLAAAPPADVAAPDGWPPAAGGDEEIDLGRWADDGGRHG